MDEPDPVAPPDELQCPAGWQILSTTSNGERCYQSRTGKRLRSIHEVHHHLKTDLGEASCTKDELLWLRTLERYGYTCKHWAAARSGVDIPEAPTFHPTMEEFSDPGRYVANLMPTISKWGICKVVPPKGWSPEPWSGKPPQGAATSPIVCPTARVHGDDAVERACIALSGGGAGPKNGGSGGSDAAYCSGMEGRNDGDVGRVEVSPRVQLLALFNTSFESFAGTLSLRQYRELADVIWPAFIRESQGADEPEQQVCVEDAETQFWELMAGSAPKGFAMYATKLRMEARAYQEFVQLQQGPLPADEEQERLQNVIDHIPATPLCMPISLATAMESDNRGVPSSVYIGEGGATAAMPTHAPSAACAVDAVPMAMAMGTAVHMATASAIPLAPAPMAAGPDPAVSSGDAHGEIATRLNPRGWHVRILPEIPWELQGAPPVLARPARWRGCISESYLPSEAPSEKRRWSRAEDEQLKEMRGKGHKWADIGSALGRSTMAVKMRWFGKMPGRNNDGVMASENREDSRVDLDDERCNNVSNANADGVLREVEDDDVFAGLHNENEDENGLPIDPFTHIPSDLVPHPMEISGIRHRESATPSAPPSPPHDLLESTRSMTKPSMDICIEEGSTLIHERLGLPASTTGDGHTVPPSAGGLKGMWVRVHGLKSNAHLNGKIGKAQDWDVASKRYHVQFKGERKMLGLKAVYLSASQSPVAIRHARGVQVDTNVSIPKDPSCGTTTVNATSTSTSFACTGVDASATELHGDSASQNSSRRFASRCSSTDSTGSFRENNSDADAGVVKESIKRQRTMERLEKGKKMCSTPGCTLKRFHFGPCSSEIVALTSEQGSTERSCRPSRRAAQAKNYRLLADEIDERDYGWAPEAGRRSLGTWAAEDERSNKRAAVMAAASCNPSNSTVQAGIIGAHAPCLSAASTTVAKGAGTVAFCAEGMTGAASAAAAAKAARDAGVHGDYSLLSKGEAMRRALSALNIQSLGSPCSLYASDIPYGGIEPECEGMRGELTSTRTRSGVMDSLLRASLLRFSPPIPGVNYPMTYIGTRNTFFCWHVEDNMLYATNYVVAGAPKVWYGVPLHAMEAMEDAWRTVFPSLFTRHPDLRYWKTSIFSPAVLRATGVPVFRLVAEPGTFVFTEPGAYHCGLNTGFNVAESTNFAFPDWFPVGEKAIRRYRTPPTRDSTLLHDALLCVAAHYAEAHEARDLVPHLQAAFTREATARRQLAADGIVVPSEPTTPPHRGDNDEAADVWPMGWDHAAAERDGWRCRVCRHLCYFSVVRCSCSVDFLLCPEHGMHVTEADEGQPKGYVHFDEDETLDVAYRQQSHPLEIARRFSGLRSDVGSDASIQAEGATHGTPNKLDTPSVPPSPPSAASEMHGSPRHDLEPPSPAGLHDPDRQEAHSSGGREAHQIRLPHGNATSASTEAAISQHSVTQKSHRWIRFGCAVCSRRLKAEVPPGSRRVTATCFSCNSKSVINIAKDGVIAHAQTAQRGVQSMAATSPKLPDAQSMPQTTVPHAVGGQVVNDPRVQGSSSQASPVLPVVSSGANVGLAESIGPCITRDFEAEASPVPAPCATRLQFDCRAARSMGSCMPPGAGGNSLLPRPPCTCDASQRQLIVRHPLLQIQQLISKASERVK